MISLKGEMNLMKKNLLLLPIIACLGLASSCTGTDTSIASVTASDSETSVSVENTSEEDTSEVVADNFITEPTTIEFVVKTGKDNAALIDDYVAGFEKTEPNVTVNVTAISGSYTDVHTKIINGITIGDYPDLTVCYPDHVADYMSYNKVVNIQNYIDNDEYGWTADDREDMIDAFVTPGAEYSMPGTYSVPFSKSTEALFYNKDALLGITLPGVNNGQVINEHYMNNLTWEELMDNFCPAIMTYNETTPILTTSETTSNNGILGYDSEANLFITLLEQYGYDYTTLDQITGEASVDFNTPKVKALAAKFNAYAKEHYIVGGKANGNSGYCSAYFQANNILMNVGSTGGLTYEYTKDFNIGVAPIPQAAGSEANKTISQGPDICLLDHNDSNRELASWLFYKYLTNTDNSIDWATNSTGYMPVRQSCYDNEDYIELNDISEQTEKTEDMLRALVSHYGEAVSDETFTSPAFKGSTTCRDAVQGLMEEIMTFSTETSSFDDMFNSAVTDCLKAM